VQNFKMSSVTVFLGFLGEFFFVMFFGIQSPQIPFKKIILVLGILLLIPVIYGYFKRK